MEMIVISRKNKHFWIGLLSLSDKKCLLFDQMWRRSRTSYLEMGF